MAALYRKYRPQSFAEVVGQEAVVRTLSNAIGTDAVRQAYLFAGPRGTGKTSMARILAKCLNCLGADGKASGPTSKPCQVPQPITGSGSPLEGMGRLSMGVAGWAAGTPQAASAPRPSMPRRNAARLGLCSINPDMTLV